MCLYISLLTNALQTIDLQTKINVLSYRLRSLLVNEFNFKGNAISVLILN